MFRTISHSGFDSESLQADVMRFMAIIGFCLVAIFALVRENTVAPILPVLPERSIPTPQPEPIPEPASERVVAEAPQPPAEAPVVQARPTRTVPLEPTATEAPTPNPMTRTSAATARDASTPPAPAEPSPSEVADADPVDEEPGLTLSFTSDRDFIRLITAARVELFVLPRAEAAAETLRFDPSQQFVASGAPGRIYELLPTTIPRLITTALTRAHPEYLTPTWGVRLPESIESEIAAHRDRASTGQLLIDRHARVRHVPAS